MEVEYYTMGKSRVPPWAGDALEDITYTQDGRVESATVKSANGSVLAKVGDVLVKIPRNKLPVVVKKKDAEKFGIK